MVRTESHLDARNSEGFSRSDETKGGQFGHACDIEGNAAGGGNYVQQGGGSSVQQEGGNSVQQGGGSSVQQGAESVPSLELHPFSLMPSAFLSERL